MEEYKKNLNIVVLDNILIILKTWTFFIYLSIRSSLIDLVILLNNITLIFNNKFEMKKLRKLFQI